MAVRLENSFEMFELTTLEYEEAVTFSNSLRSLLQTQKGSIANQILQLSFRKEDQEESLILHRYLSGKLDMLEELLSLQSNITKQQDSEDVRSGRNPQLT